VTRAAEDNGLLIDLKPFLAHLPAWLLVLFRLTGMFMFAPMFGSVTIPARVKVFLALGLSFCVYPMLLTPGSASAGLILPFIESGLGLWSVVSSVSMELLIGIVIGYGASLPLIGVQIGGRVVDQQMGLGLAGVLNPEFNEQTGVVSQFYFMLALAVFVILGGHRVILMTLVGSFGRVPLGGLSVDGQLLGLVVGLMETVFEMAFRISGPLLCLIFLQTVAMGFIARTVPQMNILSIGFALRILIGALVLIGSIGVINGVFVTSMRQTLRQIQLFFTL
jgi:flagellar biosynthetic protein FliR